MKTRQIADFILESLEHEIGGVKIYETALKCALNPELKGEWERYLTQTRNHVVILEDVCESFDINSDEATSGRLIVRHNAEALVEAMNMAVKEGNLQAAEIVACEAVVLAETKDHADWELLGKCAEKLGGARGEVLKAAHAQIEGEEDEHLYHTKGWCRELWLQSLGLSALLPPPEERLNVRSAVAAARAEKAADLKR